MNNEKDDLLTLAEAAKLLKCSRSLLYRLIEQGYPLPVIRVGALLRFNKTELIEFFRSGRLTEARQEKIDAMASQMLRQKRKLQVKPEVVAQAIKPVGGNRG